MGGAATSFGRSSPLQSAPTPSRKATSGRVCRLRTTKTWAMAGSKRWVGVTRLSDSFPRDLASPGLQRPSA